MSKVSEQREQEPGAAPAKKGPRWIWILIILGMLFGGWAGYDYYAYRQAHALDEFAKCVSGKGARMYGAWWCPHCAEQKELFGQSFHYVAYSECGIEGQRHGMNEQCKSAGIQHFPTWQFADGHREEGVFPLADLAARTGCTLP